MTTLAPLAAIVTLIALLCEPAAGQYPPRRLPLIRPTTSPYLNLFRGRNGNRSFAFNYFTLVRPELQLRSQIRRQGAALQRMQARQNQQAQQGASPLGPTGHSTSFLNYSGHFLNIPGCGTRGR